MQGPEDGMQRCYDKKIKEIVHAGGRMGLKKYIKERCAYEKM